MASRKYGALVPEHRPPDPDITRDVPDTTDVPEVSSSVIKLAFRGRTFDASIVCRGGLEIENYHVRVLTLHPLLF